MEKHLLELAKETDVRYIPAYSPLPKRKLVEHIGNITEAASYLGEEDKLFYGTRQQEVPFNLSFKVVPDAVEELLTKETLTASMEMLLKVKKPDYLGESMWEFRYENRNITGKILDIEWLKSFQSRTIDIRPGDSLRVIIEIITKYDYNNDVVSIRHNVEKVIDVIPFEPTNQGSFF